MGKASAKAAAAGGEAAAAAAVGGPDGDFVDSQQRALFALLNCYSDMLLPCRHYPTAEGGWEVLLVGCTAAVPTGGYPAATGLLLLQTLVLA